MSLRRLCRQTGKQPSKVLFFFPEENKTGIAPTRIIVEKDILLNERMHVTVNWGGEIVGAEIVALSGKLSILNLLRFISLVIVRRISLTSQPFSLDTSFILTLYFFFLDEEAVLRQKDLEYWQNRNQLTVSGNEDENAENKGNSLPERKKVAQRKVRIRGSF